MGRLDGLSSALAIRRREETWAGVARGLSTATGQPLQKPTELANRRIKACGHQASPRRYPAQADRCFQLLLKALSE
jgi:hypothetical protein